MFVALQVSQYLDDGGGELDRLLEHLDLGRPEVQSHAALDQLLHPGCGRVDLNLNEELQESLRSVLTGFQGGLYSTLECEDNFRKVTRGLPECISQKISSYLYLCCDTLGIGSTSTSKFKLPLNMGGALLHIQEKKWEVRAWTMYLPTKDKGVASTRQAQRKRILMINSGNLQYWMLSKEQESQSDKQSFCTTILKGNDVKGY